MFLVAAATAAPRLVPLGLTSDDSGEPLVAVLLPGEEARLMDEGLAAGLRSVGLRGTGPGEPGGVGSGVGMGMGAGREGSGGIEARLLAKSYSLRSVKTQKIPHLLRCWSNPHRNRHPLQLLLPQLFSSC